MSLPDLEDLLKPISDASPAGDDLEYDLDFTEVDRLSQGTPDKVIRIKDPANPNKEIDKVVSGEEPDWRTVREGCVKLFKRTKDLRVAVHLTRALTRVEGLEGLAFGAALVKNLLDRYWDPVFPRVDPEEPKDPVLRNNALAPFADNEDLIRLLRAAPLVESREVGRFTVRDLEVADGTLHAPEGHTPANADLVNAAFRGADLGPVIQRKQAVEAALVDLDGIENAFKQHGAFGPDLTAAKKLLKRVQTAYAPIKLPEPPKPEQEQTAMDSAGAPLAPTADVQPEASVPGQLRTRADVKRALEQVCEFLERSEPSNPAPLLVRRALKLLDMSFMDILREVAPDAVKPVEALSGGAAPAQK